MFLNWKLNIPNDPRSRRLLCRLGEPRQTVGHLCWEDGDLFWQDRWPCCFWKGERSAKRRFCTKLLQQQIWTNFLKPEVCTKDFGRPGPMGPPMWRTPFPKRWPLRRGCRTGPSPWRGLWACQNFQKINRRCAGTWLVKLGADCKTELHHTITCDFYSSRPISAHFNSANRSAKQCFAGLATGLHGLSSTIGTKTERLVDDCIGFINIWLCYMQFVVRCRRHPPQNLRNLTPKPGGRRFGCIVDKKPIDFWSGSFHPVRIQYNPPVELLQ